MKVVYVKLIVYNIVLDLGLIVVLRVKYIVIDY